ncbi:MAG: four helix bundle protein [Salibacteraceae bacterium]|jgi:four helix bundle protein
MRDFKKFTIWELGIEISRTTYSITKQFPKEELYGITQQMRRAGVSIPSNIAEGCGRETDKEFMRFLDIAQGSAHELETQIIIVEDFDWVEKVTLTDLKDRLNKLQRSINNLKQKIKN